MSEILPITPYPPLTGVGKVKREQKQKNTQQQQKQPKPKPPADNTDQSTPHIDEIV